MTRAQIAALSGLVLMVLVTAPVLAASGVSCHCFRDRSYDPANPAGADDYVLATAQNSFLASALGVPKKEVVRAKMTGTSAPDLWVAHTLAKELDLPAAEFLDAHPEAEPWDRTLQKLGVPVSILDADLAAAFSPGTLPAKTAGVAVDRTIATRLAVPEAQVRELRAAGATDAETIAASVLSLLLGRSPAAIYFEVSSGSRSWGSSFDSAGVAPTEIEHVIRSRLVP